jgi:hypothetical protein
LTEKGLDKLTGGEERVAEWLTGRPNPAPPHRSP